MKNGNGRARAARYDAVQGTVVIEMQNDVALVIPARLIEGLELATDEQRAAVVVSSSGNGLHWDDIDVQMSVPGLVRGLFGSPVWMEKLNQMPTAADMGRKGGAARNAAKSAAVRANGRKGGRPRKVVKAAATQ